MNLGSLIVPALVGYWVVSGTHLLKPTLAQTPAFAFALLCATVGIGLGLIATTLSYVLHMHSHGLAGPATWLKDQLTLNDLSTVGILLLGGLFVPIVTNRVYPKAKVAQNWLVPDESPLDRTLREAFEERKAKKKGGLVEVVTHTSDAYIGFVRGPEHPWEWPDDILIVPLVIGYRRAYDRVFVPTAYFDRSKSLAELVLLRSSVTSVAKVTGNSVTPPTPKSAARSRQKQTSIP